MRNIKVLLAAWLLCFSSQAWSADFFDLFFGDFEEELIAARDEGKQGVFVFFEMDDCPFCQRMQETILREADVIAYFQQHFKNHHFNILSSTSVIDFDGKEFETGKEMAEKKYRVRATPVMIFFDLEGRPVVRFTGPTTSKEEFLLLGEFFVSGSYKTMPFTRYKRTRSQ
ncbi:MAG: thioredoxin fold domain-containing protein [Gammaproteobacteria bacterium]|nr:thioredoxin fold domain-containing protein [Gammaproteobacteria bacterium]